MSDSDELAKCAAILATRLPDSQLRIIANVFDKTAFSRTEVLDAVAQPEARAAVGQFFDKWQASGGHVPGAVVAAMLRASTFTVEYFSRETASELVWTGSTAGSIPLRRTEQALLEMIDGAHERLLFVSYAVYRVRQLGDALLAAAHRGVAVTLVLEPPDPASEESLVPALRNLSSGLAKNAQILFWPLEKRPKDEHGHTGVLHAKCAIADAKVIFISSANLTEAAFNNNMELGVLLRGGPLPQRVARHFDDLLAAGVLQRMS